jgi:transketolase
MDMSPLPDKWKSFGWDCYEVDGHNIDDLHKTFNSLDYNNQIPKVIIADTTKGKGVSFMENNPSFHGKAPSLEQLIDALHELKFSKKSVIEAGKQMNISESLLSKISENY